MKVITCALVFISCFSGSVRGACEPPHATIELPNSALTQEQMDLRYRIYLAACTKVGGDLIDSESTTYHDRIGLGVLAKMAPIDLLPQELLRKGESGVVSVAAIIESTGKVTEVMLIGTSGYKSIDKNALKLIRHHRYQQPFTLDGVPIRVFKTYVIASHSAD